MITAAYAKHLDANVTGLTFTPGTATGNVYLEYLPSGPDTAVAVMLADAEPQLSQLPIDVLGVQVLVRGPREDLSEANRIAADVYSQLNCLDLTTLDDGGTDEVFVVTTTAVQSGPIPLGQDANQRYGYSVNFRARTAAPTAHRPGA